jgi:hypothetical protein
MTERKQIPLRVSAKKKKEWESYQEELGFGSREAMIRRAVEYFYATQTGEANDELQDEISTQLDSINRRLGNVQSDIADMRDNQLEKDDIPDIAEEVDYILSESRVLDTFSEFDISEFIENPEEFEGEPFVDGLTDSLAAKGFLPEDDEQLEINRALAVEYTLTGFSMAVHAIRDPVERKRLDDLYEEFSEEMRSLQ